MKYKVKQDNTGWYIEGIPGRRIYYSTEWKAELYINKQLRLEAKLNSGGDK